MSKINICKQTRKYAAHALKKALSLLLSTNNPISEIDLRDDWLKELRKNPDLFPDGWYIPPPHGVIVLFGDGKDAQRLHHKSARPQEFWPKSNIFLDKNNGLMALYSSPVDKKTAIIGDFELTLYLGKDEKIRKHLRKAFEVNQEIFDYIKTGMRFLDITKFALNLIAEKNLSNDIVSSSDPAGTNIGHSIPGIFEGWTSKKQRNINSGNPQIIADTISKKRIFVNLKEHTEVKPGMAFTIEPRLLDLKNRKMPMSSFHTIVLIHENGKKELLTNFDKIFKLAGMNYMPN